MIDTVPSGESPVAPVAAVAAVLRPPGDTDRPAATFAASRDDLLGSGALLGSAELARAACRRATRSISVLAVTAQRMRRVDAWLTGEAIVTHAMSPDRARPTVGSVCDRRHAPAVLGSILDTLLAPVPRGPASAPVAVRALGSVAPGALPPGVDRLAIVTVVGDAPPERWVLAVTDDGIAAGDATRVGDPVRLTPIAPGDAVSRLAELAGDPLPNAAGGSWL